MNEIVNFMLNHSELFTLPSVLFYIGLAFYAVGWFLSADYYDRINKIVKVLIIGKDEDAATIIIPVFFCCVLYGMYNQITEGLQNEINMMINLIYLVALYLPIVAISIIGARKSIRKKRGKL